MRSEIQNKGNTSAHSSGKGKAMRSTKVGAADAAGDVAVVHATLVSTSAPPINREQLIAEAAYHHAEARGFEPGHEVDDWLAAEAEVNARLSSEGCHY